LTVENKRDFIINTTYIAIIAVLAYLVFKYLTVLLLPFVIGFVFALVLQRPVTYLSEKTKIPRGIWSLVLVIGVIGLIIGVLFLLSYLLYDQLLDLTTSLVANLPALQQRLSKILVHFSGWLDNLPPSVEQAVLSSPSQIAEIAITFLSNFLTSAATGVIINVPSLLLTTVISVAACCFITIDYYKITNFILCQFTLRTQKVLLKSKRVFTKSIVKMLRGYSIVLLVTFVELFIGFLVLGIDYAAVLALLIAVVDILPVLGTGVVLIPWAVVDFIIGKPLAGVGLLVLYIIITLIRNMVEPKIIGQQVGLPPVVTLIAMYVGLKLFGFAGLWGVPVIMIVLVNLQESGMLRIWKEGKRISASVAEEQKTKNKI
jgi:sporulation integral membrane protein YtvI